MAKKFAEWSTAEVNDLPDSSFAYIEDGGEKDSDGKTAPRSKRHLPYKNKDGEVDLPHARNALARLDQTKAIPEGERDAIRKKLEAALEKAKASALYCGVFPFEFDDKGAAQLPSAVHLIPIGSWEHDLYGPININASDVAEFIRNFDAQIRKGVFITAGHEGSAELPAQGWITRVYARDNGLWGDVEWTKLGEQTLSDKQYKFFSPEFYLNYKDPETHQQYRNVLTGGALTKSPYFKELEAVVFSDKNLEASFSKLTMNIADILKKKAADRSAEEKQYLKDHKSEMSEAQAKQFDDESGEKKPDDEKKEASEKAAQVEAAKKLLASEGVEMISAAEKAALTEKANKGAEALTKLEASELNTAVTALVFSDTNKNGRFLPKSEEAVKTFMQTLNADQRKAFADLIGQLPEQKLFSETGDAGAGNGTGAVAKEVDSKVTALMASDKLSYSEALRRVFSETPGLQDRYDAEVQGN